VEYRAASRISVPGDQGADQQRRSSRSAPQGQCDHDQQRLRWLDHVPYQRRRAITIRTAVV